MINKDTVLGMAVESAKGLVVDMENFLTESDLVKEAIKINKETPAVSDDELKNLFSEEAPFDLKKVIEFTKKKVDEMADKENDYKYEAMVVSNAAEKTFTHIQNLRKDLEKESDKSQSIKSLVIMAKYYDLIFREMHKCMIFVKDDLEKRELNKILYDMHCLSTDILLSIDNISINKERKSAEGKVKNDKEKTHITKYIAELFRLTASEFGLKNGPIITLKSMLSKNAINKDIIKFEAKLYLIKGLAQGSEIMKKIMEMSSDKNIDNNGIHAAEVTLRSLDPSIDDQTVRSILKRYKSDIEVVDIMIVVDKKSEYYDLINKEHVKIDRLKSKHPSIDTKQTINKSKDITLH